MLLTDARYPFDGVEHEQSRKNSFGFTLDEASEDSRSRIAKGTYGDAVDQFIAFPIENEKNLRFLARHNQEESVVGFGRKREETDVGTKLFFPQFGRCLERTIVPNVQQDTRSILGGCYFTRRNPWLATMDANAGMRHSDLLLVYSCALPADWVRVLGVEALLLELRRV